MKENFLLGFYWKSQSLTAGEYISFAKDYLYKLQKIDSSYKKIYSWGDSPDTGAWLMDDFQNFEEIVLNHINDKEIKYQNPNPNIWDITPDSKSPVGFFNIFSTAIKGDDKVSITIKNGSDNNFILFKFPKGCVVNDLQFIIKLLKLTVNFAKPEYAILISSELRREIEHDDDEINLNIGWLTYFSDPSIAQFLPAGTEYETLPEGGVLIKLKDEMPSADNPEDIHAAIKIRDSLVNHGITRWDQIKHKI